MLQKGRLFKIDFDQSRQYNAVVIFETIKMQLLTQNATLKYKQYDTAVHMNACSDSKKAWFDRIECEM